MFKWVQVAKEEEFLEYKKKENSKWLERSKIMGFKFPLFENFQEFKDAVNYGKVINLEKIRFDIKNMTNTENIKVLDKLVKSYKKHRDIDRIITGMENGDSIPMPIVLEGEKGYYIFSVIQDKMLLTSKIFQLKQY